MKKALALTLILLIVAIPVLAEGWDFASMTTDELIELRTAINAELATRGEDGWVHLQKGGYVIGTDLDPDVYIFRWADPEDGSLIVIYDHSDFRVGGSYWEKFYSDSKEVRYRVEEGWSFVVSGENGIDIKKADDKIIVP